MSTKWTRFRFNCLLPLQFPICGIGNCPSVHLYLQMFQVANGSNIKHLIWIGFLECSQFAGPVDCIHWYLDVYIHLSLNIWMAHSHTHICMCNNTFNVRISWPSIDQFNFEIHARCPIVLEWIYISPSAQVPPVSWAWHTPTDWRSRAYQCLNFWTSRCLVYKW